MADNFKELFSSKSGAYVYEKAVRALSDFSMDEKLKSGVLIGLSGGADSVMLLLFLLKYRSENEYFPILAVHINHLIRGDEAQRDEDFSSELCKALGVDFIAVKIDVPTLSKESGKSIEEAARLARYNAFEDIIKGRSDISTIAVAHNADDNLETVIINMMRGAGTLGMSGINPIRDKIIRPLIYIRKSEIESALFSEKREFVTDSTNEEDKYTRNYIRHNILPKLYSAFPAAHIAALKMCENLREDNACLFEIARAFTLKYENGKIPTTELSSLHNALFFRVLKIYFSSVSERTLERVHVDAIRAKLAEGDDFSLSVPGGIDFAVLGGLSGFSYNDKAEKNQGFSFELSENVTEIPDFSARVEFNTQSVNDNCIKVYNISTQKNLASAIIKGKLYIRNKLDGDAYFYGGITHKLKKLFNDKKIPSNERENVPVLCDDMGIVWVPGFGVRDDGGNADLTIRILVNTNSRRHFYLLGESKKER